MIQQTLTLKNKLASLDARLVRYILRPTDRPKNPLVGVKCRAINVAKSKVQSIETNMHVCINEM